MLTVPVSVLVPAATITSADVFTSPVKRMPKNGEPATTLYHGIKYVGTLAEMDDRGRGKLMFDPAKYYGPHAGPYIFIGYDEPSEWDASENRWNCVADYD